MTKLFKAMFYAAFYLLGVIFGIAIVIIPQVILLNLYGFGAGVAYALFVIFVVMTIAVLPTV